MQKVLYWTTLLLVVAMSSSVNAQLYGKPELRFSSFFAPNELDLEDIQGLSSEHWTPILDDTLSTSLISSSILKHTRDSQLWIRIQLPRRSGEDKVWVELTPNTGVDGRIAQYIDGRWQWFMPEGREPSELDRSPVNFLTFELDTKSSQKVAYLKLHTSQVYHFKLHTLTQNERLWKSVSSNLFNGFILGFLCLAFIYNLVIGLTSSEKVFLNYAFFVICNLLYIAVVSGYLRLLFPDWGGMGNMGNLASCLLLFSALMFVRIFLETEHYASRLDKALRILQGITFFTLLFITFVNELAALIIAISLGVIMPVAVISAAVIAMRNGHPYARYFLFAWGIYLATVCVWVAMWMGQLKPNTFNIEILKVGTLIEITLLSVVLAYRYSFLKDQTSQLEKAKKDFQTLSETDDLTGVLNRRGFLKEAEQLIIEKNNNAVWLAMDLDHFKHFNERHGHIAGDHLLAEFGNILDTNQRREDLAAKLLSDSSQRSYRRAIAGRIGGEEFAVLLTDCTMAQAKLYAERLLEEFRNLLVDDPLGSKVGTTVSIGATRVGVGDSLETVWQRADKRLLEAKKLGRDQVVVD